MGNKASDHGKNDHLKPAKDGPLRHEIASHHGWVETANQSTGGKVEVGNLSSGTARLRSSLRRSIIELLKATTLAKTRDTTHKRAGQKDQKDPSRGKMVHPRTNENVLAERGLSLCASVSPTRSNLRLHPEQQRMQTGQGAQCGNLSLFHTPQQHPNLSTDTLVSLLP